MYKEMYFKNEPANKATNKPKKHQKTACFLHPKLLRDTSSFLIVRMALLTSSCPVAGRKSEIQPQSNSWEQKGTMMDTLQEINISHLGNPTWGKGTLSGGYVNSLEGNSLCKWPYFLGEWWPKIQSNPEKSAAIWSAIGDLV